MPNERENERKNPKDIIKLKKFLKNIKWEEISNNWDINDNRGAGTKIISLNPYQDCSKSNPLYKKKEWLIWIYTNKDINFNDQLIAELCKCNSKTIGNWRKKYNIQSKKKYSYFKEGYKFLLMLKEYKHPELNPKGKRRINRAEHIVLMENYLNEKLTLKELSQHPCLIKNENRYYIKIKSVVHHINHKRLDNKIENLWIYKDECKHSNTKIFSCFSGLIKLGQIKFTKGHYFIDFDYDYKCLTHIEIDNMIKRNEFIDYSDLELVKRTIKNIEWSDMEWCIEYRMRNNAPLVKIKLDPHKDCSEENPLYRHKGWIQRIVYDKRFYLTDRRLSELCGISTNIARRWRQRYHKIKPRYWGYDKILLLNSGGKKIIYQKIPNDYGNPFAIQKVNHSIMRESRYIIEKNLAKQPELNKKYLIDGKYLKPEYLVHHINLDVLDNKITNLYICEGNFEHNRIHDSLIKLIDNLLKYKLLTFKNGIYSLCYP